MGDGITHTAIGAELTQSEYHAEGAHTLSTGTSFPGSPSQTDTYYRTDQNKWYIYGISWIELTSQGNDLTSISSNLIPDTTNNYDIGENSTPLKWKDLHLAGHAYIGGRAYFGDGDASIYQDGSNLALDGAGGAIIISKDDHKFEGDIYPDGSNTRNVGSSTAEWATGYFVGLTIGLTNDATITNDGTHLILDGAGGVEVKIAENLTLAENVYMISGAPTIFFDDTGESDPAGEFLIIAETDLLMIQGRNSGDSAHESILELSRVHSGGTVTFYGDAIVPSATGGGDLGTSSLHWGSIYVDDIVGGAHALGTSGPHTGDLAYTQLDALVDVAGGGSASLISGAQHVHTAADGSSKVDHGNMLGLGDNDHSQYRDAGYLNTGILLSARISPTQSFYQTDPRLPATNEVHNTLSTPTIAELSIPSSPYIGNKLLFVVPTISEYTENGVDWYATSYTATQLKKWVAGRNMSANLVIPSPTTGEWEAVRFTFTSPGYRYINWLYVYTSTSGHQLNVKIEKSYGAEADNWIEVATTSLWSSWPGHQSVPHSNIPWHPTPTPGTHSKYIRLTFYPTYNGSYPNNAITLYNINWYGYYPANPQQDTWYWDEDNNFYVKGDIIPTATTFDLGGSSAEWQNLYLGGTLYFYSDQNEWVYSDGNKLILGADGADKLVIDNTIVHPASANTIDLGAATAEWKDAYIAGTLKFMTDQQEYIFSDGTNLIFGVGGANHYIASETQFRPSSGGDHSLGNTTTYWQSLYLSGTIYMEANQSVTINSDATGLQVDPRMGIGIAPDLLTTLYVEADYAESDGNVVYGIRVDHQNTATLDSSNQNMRGIQVLSKYAMTESGYSGTNYAIYAQAYPTGTQSFQWQIGVYGQGATSYAGASMDNLAGLYGLAYNSGTGTVTNAYGMLALVEVRSTTGTISNGIGVMSRVYHYSTSDGDISVAKTFYANIDNDDTSGTATIGTGYLYHGELTASGGADTLTGDAYGLYLDVDPALVDGTSYGIYIADADENYITGRVTIIEADDVDLAGVSGALIIGGDGAGAHIAMDANELQAKSNATTATTLNIQASGGTTTIGTSSLESPISHYGATSHYNGDWLLDDLTIGSNVDSPYLYLRGNYWDDPTNYAINGRISLQTGADPYIRFDVSDDGVSPTTISSFRMYDTAFTPHATGAADLGSASLHWGTIYVDTITGASFGATTFTGLVTIDYDDDIDLVGVSGDLIIGGDGTGAHIAIDQNEIQSKASATTAAGLNLQLLGGAISIGTSTYESAMWHYGSTQHYNGTWLIDDTTTGADAHSPYMYLRGNSYSSATNYTVEARIRLYADDNPFLMFSVSDTGTASPSVINVMRMYDSTLCPYSAGSINLGSTQLEWNILYLTDNGGVFFDAAQSERIYSDGSNLIFVANGGTYVLNNSTFRPTTTSPDTYNLGATNAEWNNIYLGTGRLYLYTDQGESIVSDGSVINYYVNTVSQYSMTTAAFAPNQTNRTLGSATNGWSDVYIAATSPEIYFDETDQTDPAGEFRIQVASDFLHFQGRNSGDSAYQDIFYIERLADGGDAVFYGSLIPAVTNADYLGTTSLRWRCLYVDGSADTDPVGFDFTAGGRTIAIINSAGDPYTVIGTLTNNTFGLMHNGSRKVRLDANGLGSVGGTDLGSTTYDWGDLYMSGYLYITGSDTNEYMYSDGGSIRWGIGGTTELFLNGTELRPETDAGLNLGSNTIRWGTGYFDNVDTNDIRLSNGMIWREDGPDTFLMDENEVELFRITGDGDIKIKGRVYVES